MSAIYNMALADLLCVPVLIIELKRLGRAARAVRPGRPTTEHLEHET